MGIRREPSQINTIVIHCADTPNGRANTIEDIDLWHRQRGFRRDLSIAPSYQPNLTAVGYHYVIEVDGTVRCGRPVLETGAHVSGHNHNTIGICLIGRDQYTNEQWIALESLVRALQMPSLVAQGLSIQHIKGHREYNKAKSCPGFDVADWVNADYNPKTKHVLEASS
ncbi:N-acetylmuramoyl-L-alanine amidase [Oceanobacter kriegii]|uniref:N-acetylmuramoyl-L-alanine amidase n=1 Tax=Oceanobacter kriegii TaxID=64972 RepID=UPI00042070C9|nr:N-acetylmuramoyl-L-alanine amidase [Oceanobacter kriegii]